jgi:hypothetical protein
VVRAVAPDESIATEATPIARLRALAGDPGAQAALALAMLDNRAATFDLVAALEVLAELAPSPARGRLLALYSTLDSGGGKNDAGGIVRAACLRALRPVAQRDDVALLERAALTVEFLPPGRQEVCAGLRAAALVVMAELDPDLAALHAVRLLRDPHENKMSGEPALTAARVLAAMEAVHALYDYALAPGDGAPEVVAECLRALAVVPRVLVEDLAARYVAQPATGPGAFIGLAEAIVARHDTDELAPAFASLLATDDLDLLEYLVALAAGRRTGALVDAVLREAEWETNPARASSMNKGLAPAAGDPRVDAIRARLGRVRAVS